MRLFQPFQKILRSTGGKVGFVGFTAILLLIFIGPLLAPNVPNAMIASPFEPPSKALPFGSDALGRDVLSRFLWGGMSLLWMSVLAALIAVVVGALMGLISAYRYGTWLDTLLMRIVDIKLAFPTIIFALLFVTMFGVSEPLLVALVGISLAPSCARVIRGAAMPVVKREYIQYARASGFPTSKILLREVLPNVSSPLLAELGLRFMWAIASISALSFLGFGIQAPKADWGLMINENRNALMVQPWAVIVPVIGIAWLTICGNLCVEALARSYARTMEDGE